MDRALRPKRKAASAQRGGQGEHACPVCMESSTEGDRFCFPCGHWICAACNAKMLQHHFLACPTCRTPREGVSQRQVESANQARVARDAGQEEGHRLTLRAGGQEMQVIFFPDESDGANPFGPLAQPPPPGAPRNQEADDFLLAQAIEAAAAVQSALPHLAESSGPMLRLEGPMRELIDRLLAPGTIYDFLAQREVVRGHAPRRQRLRSVSEASV